MKTPITVAILLLASLAGAQEAPLAAPIAKASEVRKVIGKVELSRSPVQALIQVNVMDSDGNLSRYYNVDIPRVAGDDPAHPNASIVTFLNAVMSSAPGETGTVPRRFDFRVLSYLKANGYLADTAPVVP